jgi:hypothetical protein
MPRLTKHYLGVFEEHNLVGVLTLGWGTQPLQTIRKLFPDLISEDYYEIGKMCMDDSMPRNSESQMISKVTSWMKKNTPERKYLFTWADGIVGKVGYVYQASNFLYGGFIWTDIYISKEGEKIHPRSSRKLLEENQEFIKSDKKLFWMTYDFMKHKEIKRIKGKQFRYIYPLNKKARKYLNKSTVEWSLKHPKENDLEWKEMVGKGKYELLSAKPNFDLSVVDVNKKNVNRIADKYGLSSLEEFFK